VGVLLYDPAEDAVVLVRQFRYPVYATLTPAEQAGEGARRAWLLETIAGVQDAGYTVKEIAHKELLEEAGYVVAGELHPIATIYPSPGGTSEHIHLFWAEVDRRQRAAPGGGVLAEGEDIEIVVVPFAVALDRVARGEMRDAKTVIALQHLALRRPGMTGQENAMEE
jgi:ADP-ribose pyrophosphatase